MRDGLSGLLAGSFLMTGLIFGVTGQAKANAISTFDLSGSFSSISVPFVSIPLSGSITIDITSGQIQSQSVFPNSPPGYTASFNQGYDAIAKSYYAYIFVVTGQPQQELIYFNAMSLIDYTGGSLGSTAHPTPAGAVSSYNAQLIPTDIVLTNGAATLEPTPVPEPSSVALLMFGGVGTAFAAFRRRLKRQSAPDC